MFKKTSVTFIEFDKCEKLHVLVAQRPYEFDFSDC